MTVTNLLQLAYAIRFFETTEQFVLGVDYLKFSLSYWFVTATTVDCRWALSCCSRAFFAHVHDSVLNLLGLYPAAVITG